MPPYRSERIEGREARGLLLRLARKYVVVHRWRLALVLMASILMSTQPFIIGYLGKVMVDDVLQISVGGEGDREGAATLQRAQGGSSEAQDGAGKREPEEKIRLIVLLSACFVCVTSLSAGLRWTVAYISAGIGRQMVFRLRKQLHRKLIGLHMRYLEQRQVGKLLARVLDDVTVIEDSVTQTFVDMCAQMAMLAVGAITLIKIEPRLGLVALAALPFHGVTYRIFKVRLRERWRLIRERNSEIYGLVGERLGAIRVVAAFAQERREARRFLHLAAEYIRALIGRNLLATGQLTVTGLISAAATAAVLFWGAAMVRDGQLTLGSLLYFYAAVGALFGPVGSLTSMGDIVQWVVVTLKRVFEILDEPTAISDRPGAHRLGSVTGRVTFEDVWLHYDDPSASSGQQETESALQNVQLDVPAGTVVAIVGPSGAGKTSLANLLLRLYDPTRGAVLLDGTDLRDIALVSLRSHVGLVPQEVVLFSGTIAENIVYGRLDATPAQVVEAAKAAEIHDFIYSLPEKYETGIGERGMSLSGGQKQRVAIAMALLTNPSILILDDSTSALDAATEARIWETLTKVMRGRTAFIITHRVATAMRADQIVAMERGEIIERGTHSELLTLGGRYARLFAQQRRSDVHVRTPQTAVAFRQAQDVIAR